MSRRGVTRVDGGTVGERRRELDDAKTRARARLLDSIRASERDAMRERAEKERVALCDWLTAELIGADQSGAGTHTSEGVDDLDELIDLALVGVGVEAPR